MISFFKEPLSMCNVYFQKVLDTKRLTVAFCSLLMASSLSFADVVEIEPFSNETMRIRYLHLIEELRCPKCQNQNLADSNAPIAVDLRSEVRRLLEEGKSDMEINDYLATRYGDFVLYRPPLKATTWALWGAPGLLLLIVIGVLLRVRQQQRLPQSTEKVALSSQEQQQLEKLLQEPKADSEHSNNV